MLRRCIPIFITAFWLVMVGMLGWRQFAPSRGGVADVSARELIRMFLSQEDTVVNLTVFREEEFMGDATLVTRRPGRRGAGYTDLLVNSTLTTQIPGVAGEQDIVIQGLVSLEDLENVESFRSKVRVPKMEIEAVLSVAGESEEPEYRVEQGGELLLSSDPTDGKTLADVPGLALLGIDPNNLAGDLEKRAGEVPELVVREAVFDFAGRERRVYVLPVSPEGQRDGVRIIFTPRGELVMIDAGGGYELRSLLMAGAS